MSKIRKKTIILLVVFLMTLQSIVLFADQGSSHSTVVENMEEEQVLEESNMNLEFVEDPTEEPTPSFEIEPQSAYQSNFSNIRIDKEILVFEFENMYRGISSGDRLTFPEEEISSAGRHAFYESNEVGDFIEFTFEAGAGTYQLDIRIKQFKNRGISQIYIDDESVGAPLDFYNLTARHIDTQIGQVTLDDREIHTIRFEVIGKREESTSYILGLDAMYLTKQKLAPLPAAPTNLKSGVQSDTTVNLNWTVPPQDPAITLESFEIYTDDTLTATIPANKTMVTVTDLTPGTTYSFKIRSKSRDQAYSEFSNTIQATTITGKLIYEFESLQGVTHSGDPLSRLEENMSSGGRHAFYESNEVGDWIEFPFEAEAGTYQLDLRIRQFKNRGIAQIKIDGNPIAQPLDFYNLTSRHIDTQIGQVTLDKREIHTIRFEVIGKREESTSYILGLDAMYLTPQDKDTYEPNNSATTAKEINISHLYESYISNGTDVDFYKFTSLADDTYFMTLQSPQDANYKFEIYDAELEPILSKQIVKGQDIDASFFLEKDTVIYVKIYTTETEDKNNPYYLGISPSPIKKYLYDNVNRLIRVEYGQGLYQYQIYFTYDNNGNLLETNIIKTLIDI